MRAKYDVSLESKNNAFFKIKSIMLSIRLNGLGFPFPIQVFISFLRFVLRLNNIRHDILDERP